MDESRNKAQTYYRQGEWLYSIKYAEQWLSFAKEDQTEEAAAYDILANSYNKIAKWKESIENGNHELRIAIEVGDKELEAQARTILSSSYNRVNNYEQSIEHCNQILRIPEGNKQKKWDVQAYNNLALSSYHLQGDVEYPDYNESIKYGELQLKVAKELGDREGEMAAYLNLINSCTKSGDTNKVREYSQLQQRAVQDQSQSKAAASGGFPNYSSESPQDGEHEKELAERGLTERLNSGDFKEIEEEETDEARGKLPNGSSSESPQDGEHEKELAEKGLTELSNSGDFKEIEEGETDEVRGKLPNGSCSVPSEVEARGPGAKFASENDFKTGKVKLHRARIILIGQDQAGKTSLKKSLFGLPFESEEESTEGVKVDPTVFEVEVEQVKNWPLSDDARIAAEEVKEEEPEGMKMDEGPIREEKKESATAELKIDPALSPKEVTDVLVQHLSSVNLQSDVTSVENHTTLDVWDFAGQHLYYAFFSVFLSPRAVYLMVYDLSKELKATAPPWVRKEVVKNTVHKKNETNLENLLSWLASVGSSCTDVDENSTKKRLYLRPPIFIVGTHADKPHQDIEEMENQIQTEIVKMKLDEHVIRPLFSVDNTQGSSGKELAKLRSRMNEVLKEEPYMGEEVPVRWLKFEKVVQALVAEQVYHLKLVQLQTIIQKVCFIEDENEVATMLDFYHDLGIIVKHRNTVVLQAQWLADVFKQLITIRSFNESESTHGKLWKALQDTGILSMELVNHVFSKLCPIKEDILDMMEQFGLIVKFSTSPTDENYFVPCQLEKPPANVLKMKHSPSDPFPLYLRFELGFVPHGFFSQLVSEFTRLCSMSGLIERSTASPKFYDGVSKFIMKKTLKHHLVILCKNEFIKIVLKQAKPEPSDEIEEVANAVRQSLEDAMEPLTSKIPWLKNLKPPDWCAACPHCSCLLKILLKEGHLDDCTTCHNVETLTLPGLQKWFSVKSIGPTTTKESLPAATSTIPTSQPQRPARRPTTTKASLPAATPTIPTFQPRRPGTAPVTKAELSTQKPGARYKMTANPRGITLIINNTKFADLPGKERPSTRDGTGKDVSAVQKLFSSLRFTVDTRENLTTQELKNVLDSVAKQDHSGYDCFVLWLMSHGKSGEVFCSDSVTLPIQTAHDLLSNCDTLKGKPKLFFIQACRGQEEDEIEFGEASGKSTGKSTVSVINEPPSTAVKVPKNADFLYSYSSFNEHVAYRNKVTGSYYVNALVEAFKERVWDDHLINILTVVNNKVSEISPTSPKSNKRVKTITEFSSTLRKEVWFSFKQ